jgi:hypothetical protein
MLKRILPVVLLISVCFILWSFDSITFLKTYGAEENEYSHYVEQTSDGGYIFIGHTFSNSLGNSGVYLVKTDSYGNELWHKVYSGTSKDAPPEVHQTKDGGYILMEYLKTKNTDSSMYYADVILIKTDSAGNEQWRNTYGGEDINISDLSMDELNDGSLFIGGSVRSIVNGSTSGESEIYLLKTDSCGNEIWTKRFGKSDDSLIFRSLRHTEDNGCIITGCTFNQNTREGDLYLAKIDSSGSMSWSKIFNFTEFDTGVSIQQTVDVGYAVLAEITGSGEETTALGNHDLLLLKTDSCGNEIWEKVYNIDIDDTARYLEQTEDGGFIITGISDLWNSKGIFLLKTDPYGNEIWRVIYDEIIRGSIYCGRSTTDGGYILTGNTSESEAGGLDAYLLKVDSQGNIE